MSILLSDKKEILGDGAGVVSNKRKLSLIQLLFGQQETLFSNQPSKLISISKSISSVYRISDCSFWL